MIIKIESIESKEKSKRLKTDKGTIWIANRHQDSNNVKIGVEYEVEIQELKSSNPAYGPTKWINTIKEVNAVPQKQAESAQKPLNVIRSYDSASIKAFEQKSLQIAKSCALNNSCTMTLAFTNLIKGQFATQTPKDIKTFLDVVQKEYYQKFYATLTGLKEDAIAELAEEVTNYEAGSDGF
jgi:hypothetical protein